jgi:arylsulfatase A-like enzyme
MLMGEQAVLGKGWFRLRRRMALGRHVASASLFSNMRPIDRLGFVLVAMLLGLGCARDEPPRHLILVTFDTLRGDRVGAYGYTRPTTPNLDQLAAGGIRFDDAIAQAISTPASHASILTGLNPPRHGLRRLWGGRLVDAHLTLAERLREEGFTTAAFVSGIPLRRETGLDQGFDHYDAPFGRGPLAVFKGREWASSETNQSVRDWLADRRPERLFLWVHYFDPHTPYFASLEHRRAFGVDDVESGHLPAPSVDASGKPPPFAPEAVARMSSLYDAEVLGADSAFGELMAPLRSRGLLEEAVVAVVADHGENLGEYGYYFGHWNVFDETARVPMILAHPQGRGAGRVVRQTVATVDLFPTLIAWLGLTHGEDRDGRDLGPLIEGGVLEPRPAYTEQLEHFDVRSVRSGPWLLISRRDTGVEDLWSRGSPASPASVGKLPVGERPDTRLQLRAELDRLTTGTQASRGSVTPVPPEVAEQLRALGYTDSLD